MPLPEYIPASLQTLLRGAIIFMKLLLIFSQGEAIFPPLSPLALFLGDLCYSIYFILPFFLSLFFHLSNVDYPPVMCPSCTSGAENLVASNTQALPELITHWLDVNQAPPHTNAELQTRLSARGTVQGVGHIPPNLFWAG